MVQLSTTFVLLFSLVAVGISTPIKRSIVQITADISDMGTNLSNLHAAIIQFPSTGGTLQQALHVSNLTQVLDSSIKKASADVTANGPIGASDAANIFSAVKALQPSIETTGTAIENKRPAVAALPVGGVVSLVQKDLENLDTDCINLANALQSNTPAGLADSWVSLRNAIHADFAAAIAAYS